MLRDGVFFAPTKIDESTVMPDIPAGDTPVRLNMRALRQINSYGTRRLLNFVRSVGPRGVEYLDCPSVFVDTLNIVRDLLGERRDPRRVQSYCVPHFCEACTSSAEIMVAYAQVVPSRQGFGLPPQHCSKCGAVLVADVEADEYLAFILESDLS